MKYTTALIFVIMLVNSATASISWVNDNCNAVIGAVASHTPCPGSSACCVMTRVSGNGNYGFACVSDYAVLGGAKEGKNFTLDGSVYDFVCGAKAGLAISSLLAAVAMSIISA